MLLILIMNVLNCQKSSKFDIMVLKNNYTFDYNLGFHDFFNYYNNMNHVWSQYTVPNITFKMQY
jgi:hypothetical protein